ncbi:hypothetical protein FW774_15800 [Pedobacter sp. BS3]|uniref:LiaF transmembrane domain-containing protein n=1 Tax=Pedobacter sp. BS3 TaxID=2567937 RepID=UPI0011EF5523|nr:DUF5668 domain-containing protein [Pedobacter sp. BS3]TZF82153.1 hypothetical protein FW774_15800 [Pedobacter sp. BS3]
MRTRRPRPRKYNRYARPRKALAGLLLLVIGLILLLKQLGFFFPGWLFSWPMLLIVFGIFSGVRHQFRNPGSFIMIFIGGAFLADRVVPDFNFTSFIWPMLIIMLGLLMIFKRDYGRRMRNQWGDRANWDKRNFDWNNADEPESAPRVEEDEQQPEEPIHEPEAQPEPEQTENNDTRNNYYANEDYLDTTTVFGGIKKNVISKNFKGGEVVNFMGGTEINLTQADFTGRIILDVVQVCGGTKIIVPPHWHIHSEMSAVFGGIEDRRPLHVPDQQTDKVLIIKGTSIFGGIDIRSY